MKIITKILIGILFLLFFINNVNANLTEECQKFNENSNEWIQLNCGGGGSIKSIDEYLQDTKLVDASGDMNIETGVKSQILKWIKNIGGFLALATIGAIAYGSLMMVISGGEEEKLKKAKDIIKWSILGFLGVVLAGSIITIIIEFMYTF